VLLQRSRVRGDRFGDLSDQSTKFTDFYGQRVVRRSRTLRRGRQFDLRRVETTGDLRHLASEISRAPRQVSDLVAKIGSVAQTVADRVEKRHSRQGGQRHNCRGARIDVEAEIEHRSDRGGDKNGAGRNEDGADTTHTIYPGPTEVACAMPLLVADSPGRISMSIRLWLRATRSAAMVA
jgi:hypothetical protein